MIAAYVANPVQKHVTIQWECVLGTFAIQSCRSYDNGVIFRQCKLLYLVTGMKIAIRVNRDLQGNLLGPPLIMANTITQK